MPTRPTHDPTHSVAAAAAIVGVSSSQIRNWCTQFAGHLSADANPAPGQPRTLTNADVATLQRVAELRADGVPYPEIPAQLAQLEPGDLVTFYVDSQPAPTDQPNQPAAIELLSVLEGRFQRMEAEITDLRNAQAQEERRPITLYFLLGIVAGLLIVGVAVGVLMFGAWVGG